MIFLRLTTIDSSTLVSQFSTLPRAFRPWTTRKVQVKLQAFHIIICLSNTCILKVENASKIYPHFLKWNPLILRRQHGQDFVCDYWRSTRDSRGTFVKLQPVSRGGEREREEGERVRLQSGIILLPWYRLSFTWQWHRSICGGVAALLVGCVSVRESLTVRHWRGRRTVGRPFAWSPDSLQDTSVSAPTKRCSS